MEAFQHPGCVLRFFILLQAWVQPVSGWFIDRIGQRPFITIAGLLCGIGWSGMGYATSLPMLKILYAMGRHRSGVRVQRLHRCGVEMVSQSSRICFRRYCSGLCGGAALSVWVVQHLIRDYNYHSAFIVSGLVQELSSP
jgi:OFA family oxalate/formate antiporter-like MFS transporter